MMKSRIQKLYKLLTRVEILIFPQWLNSLKHKKTNTDIYDDLLKLFSVLKGKKGRKLIWKEVYGELPYNDSKLRKLETTLGKYLEDFMASQLFRKSDLQKEVFLIKSLKQRITRDTIDADLFASILKKSRSRIERQSLRNGAYFRAIYEIEMEYQEFVIKYSRKDRIAQKKALINLQNIYWLHEKLLISLSLVYNSEDHNGEIEREMLDLMIRKIEINYLKDEYPLLEIYYLLYHVLFIDSDRSIEAILDLLEKNRLKVSQEDRLNIFYLLLNHLIQKANKTGSSAVYRELSKLYHWALKESLLLIDRVLPMTQFKNVLVAKLRYLSYANKETDCIEKEGSILLNDLSELVESDKQTECLTFGKALIYFYAKQYDQASKFLNQGFKDIHFELMARIYSIQAQYELYGSEEIRNAIRAFKTKLNRLQKHKIEEKLALSDKLVFVYKERLKMLERVIDTWDRDELRKLYEDVSVKKNIGNREWLLSKVNEKLYTS